MESGYAVMDMGVGKGKILHILKSPGEAQAKIAELRTKHPRKTFQYARITAFAKRPRKAYK